MSPTRLLITAVVVLTLSGCATSSERIDWHNNDSYSGWVTDAATGEPIEGAVVVATWQISRPWLLEGSTNAVIRLEETLTDKEGRFQFAPLGWYLPPLGWDRDEFGFPRLAFFKPGYEPTYRQRFSWEFGEETRSAPNLRGVPLRRQGWQREIQLYRYLTRPDATGVIDRSVKRNDEQKILGGLTNFAFSLARNVRVSGGDVAFGEAQRRKAVEAQWRAIVMVDEEIRKYRPQYTWSTREIPEALAATRRPKVAPPKTNVQRMKASHPAVVLPEGESKQ